MRPILLFFLLLSCPAFAQVTIRGTVIDSATRKPVPYALVMESGGKHGAIADQIGVFVFTLPDSSGTLLFTCMGYDTTRIATGQFLIGSRQAVIVHRPIILPAASIVSWKNPPCTKQLGITQKKGFNRLLGNTGMEIAVHIQGGDTGTISRLRFFISRTGIPTTAFRAKLYAVDQKTNGPGKLLIDDDLIAAAEQGNQWVEIDISAYNVPIPAEGFFVALQWLPDAQAYTLHRRDFDGQVLWLSKQVNRGYWIKHFPGSWMGPFIADFIPMIGADVQVKCD